MPKRKKKHKYHVNEDHTYEYLKEMFPDIKIEKQFTIKEDVIVDGKKIQSKVIIDFYFIKNGINYFIEYNGKQHYEPIRRFGGKKAFIKRQKRDQWVREWCKSNNYVLIEIDGREFVNEGIKAHLESIFI